MKESYCGLCDKCQLDNPEFLEAIARVKSFVDQFRVYWWAHCFWGDEGFSLPEFHRGLEWFLSYANCPGCRAVAVVDADEQQCQKFCAMFRQLDYRATPLYSRLDLEVHLQSHPDGIVILDVDTVAADNRFFRELKRQAPGLYVLALSSRSYHPGLEEAIGSHIYACLAKPLDPEELHYWQFSLIGPPPTIGGREIVT